MPIFQMGTATAGFPATVQTWMHEAAVKLLLDMLAGGARPFMNNYGKACGMLRLKLILPLKKLCFSVLGGIARPGEGQRQVLYVGNMKKL